MIQDPETLVLTLTCGRYCSDEDSSKASLTAGLEINHALRKRVATAVNDYSLPPLLGLIWLIRLKLLLGFVAEENCNITTIVKSTSGS